ncbi:MAG: MraZ protein [Actinomycetota bacterium]
MLGMRLAVAVPPRQDERSQEESAGRRMFVGNFDRSVDGAGRVALPAEFRDELGPKCYLTRHPDGFVKLTTQGQFAAEAETIRADIRAGLRPESAMRAFGAQTQIASIDKQGRITLDEGVRSHAGLKSQAIIVGSVEYLEIWRPSRYEQVRAEHHDAHPPRRWDDEDDDV